MYKFRCSAPQNRVPPFVELSRRPVTTHCLRLTGEEQREERLGKMREERLGKMREGDAVRRANEDDAQREARLGAIGYSSHFRCVAILAQGYRDVAGLRFGPADRQCVRSVPLMYYPAPVVYYRFSSLVPFQWRFGQGSRVLSALNKLIV